MGDPVSLAGTAIGVVSLGLSVCQGLISYYTTFRDCPKDAKNMLEKLESLNDVLEVLEDVLQSHDNLRTETAAVKTAKRNIQACKSGLQQLEEIRNKCQVIPAKSGQDFINRSLYPFRRGTIRAVLEHVESLQSNLDTSIDVLQLSVSSQNSDRTTVLCTTTQQIVTGYTGIHTHVENIDRVQQDLNRNILYIRKQLEDVPLHPNRQNRPILDSAGLSPLRDNHETLNYTTLSLIDTQGMPIRRPRRQKCSCSSLPAPSKARKGLLVSLWDSSHKFGCPLYMHEEKSILEWKLKFNNSLFRTSVHISLNSIRGQGRRAIFPSLNFCPIVDEFESPAFLLVDEMVSELLERKYTSPNFIRNLASKLQAIYQEGSASPRDVTSRGGNILHTVIRLVNVVPDAMMADYRDLIKHLVEFGVPLNEQSINGGVLNVLLFNASNVFNIATEFIQDQMVFLFSDLVAHDADLLSIREAGFSWPYYIAAFHFWPIRPRYSGNYLHAIARRNIYDELHSSDLEKCVISRSERDLQETISMSTTTKDPAERNYLAEICIGWPLGLRIFLNAGYDLDINHLLFSAIKCRCFDSVQMVLDHNNSVIYCSHVEAAHQTANSEIFKLVVHSLAERRRKLQELAERHLPCHIQDQLHLPKKGVLDNHAAQVYSKLKAFGIHIDPCLEVLPKAGTVYNEIDYDINAAKTLFDAGFQNLEEEEGEGENKGLTTLMQLASSGHNYMSPRELLETMVFLISKGADPHRKRHEDNRTAMHFLGSSVSWVFCGRVGMELQETSSRAFRWDKINPSKMAKAILKILDQIWSPLNQTSWTLLESLFIDCHNDTCSCACSAQGCLPSTCFFRHLVRWMSSSHNVQAIAEVIRFLGERWEAGSVKALNDTLAPTVLRICIFEFLELTHTCCDGIAWPLSGRTEQTRDDIARIRDEERFSIEQVEELTAFFVTKYHEMDLGLPEFLLEYYSIEIKKDPKAGDEEKMREYEQEKEQIRRLGVVLDESCT